MRRSHIAAAFAFSALALGCGGDSTEPSVTPEGTIVEASPSNAFNPATITIAVGGKVTWEFGSTTHTVTFDNVSGHPASIGQSSNKNVIRQFTTLGTFTYICTLHEGMAGTVIVGP